MTSVFEQPQCLIYTEQKTGRLCLSQHVLDDISSITKRINAIAIAGLYRTGKSYLLTRLSGNNKGFPLGSSIQSKTKGIWAWCVDHPKDKGQMLLLLDTEGLGDIQKGDQNNDNIVFTLATLLSSTLIYNQLGVFNDNSLDKLTFITEMSKNIKTSDSDQSESSDDAFDVYFPEFILTLRDFTLELVVDGKEISSDKYLDDVCLKAKEGDSDEIKRFNEPRLCIREYFKRRKCFVFGFPTTRRQIKNLENMDDTDLLADFVEDTHIFLSYVFDSCQPMKMKNGTHLNGRMYSNLAINYVEAIRNGAIPCIKTALESMALIENTAAVEEAVKIYEMEMETNADIPTESDQDLRDVHLKSKELAFNHFLKHRVLDDEDTYKKQLDDIVMKRYSEWVTKNENISESECRNVLKELHAQISRQIKAGVYATPGGYETYSKDRTQLKLKYYETLRLGVMKEEAFAEYCNYIQTEDEAVLKSDQSISEKERVLNLEKESRGRAEKQAEIMKQKLEQSKKENEDIAEQLKNEFKQLQDVHAKEMDNERKRMEQVAEKRIQEIERLHKENVSAAREQGLEQMMKFHAEMHKKEVDYKEQLNHANAQHMQNMLALIAANKAEEEERRRGKCTIS